MNTDDVPFLERNASYVLPTTSARREEPLFLHQSEIIARFFQEPICNGVIHLPTGGGKTRIAIEIISRLLKEDPGTRIIWVTYPLILLQQGIQRVQEMAGLFPEHTKCVWFPTQDTQETSNYILDHHISFMMRDTLTKVLRCATTKNCVQSSSLMRAILNPDIHRIAILYDESHQLQANNLVINFEKLYHKLNSEQWQKLLFTGLSATPVVTGEHAAQLLQTRIFPIVSGRTTHSEWNIHLHCSIGIGELQERHILCPLNPVWQEQGFFDIPGELIEAAGMIPIPNGRNGMELRLFAQGFNSRVMSDEKVIEFLADRIASRLEYLGKTIIFMPNIKASEYMAEQLYQRLGAGFVSLVHSRLNEYDVELTVTEDHEAQSPQANPLHARDQVNEFIRRGSQPCIMINVGMLTTGFDDPKIKTVIMARLTFSTNLFWQMLGRGLRGVAAGGTEECFFIDPINFNKIYHDLDAYRPKVFEDGCVATLHTQEEEHQQTLLRRLPPITAQSNFKFSTDINLTIRQLLIDFIKGNRILTLDEYKQVRQLKAEAILADDGNTDIHFSATFGVENTEANILIPIKIKNAITEFQGLHKGQDFSWLHLLEPTSESPEAAAHLSKRLRAIKRDEILTHDAFLSYEANLYN